MRFAELSKRHLFGFLLFTSCIIIIISGSIVYRYRRRKLNKLFLKESSTDATPTTKHLIDPVHVPQKSIIDKIHTALAAKSFSDMKDQEIEEMFGFLKKVTKEEELYTSEASVVLKKRIQKAWEEYLKAQGMEDLYFLLKVPSVSLAQIKASSFALSQLRNSSSGILVEAAAKLRKDLEFSDLIESILVSPCPDLELLKQAKIRCEELALDERLIDEAIDGIETFDYLETHFSSSYAEMLQSLDQRNPEAASRNRDLAFDYFASMLAKVPELPEAKHLVYADYSNFIEFAMKKYESELLSKISLLIKGNIQDSEVEKILVIVRCLVGHSSVESERRSEYEGCSVGDLRRRFDTFEGVYILKKRECLETLNVLLDAFPFSQESQEGIANSVSMIHEAVRAVHEAKPTFIDNSDPKFEVTDQVEDILFKVISVRSASFTASFKNLLGVEYSLLPEFDENRINLLVHSWKLLRTWTRSASCGDAELDSLESIDKVKEYFSLLFDLNQKEQIWNIHSENDKETAAANLALKFNLILARLLGRPSVSSFDQVEILKIYDQIWKEKKQELFDKLRVFYENSSGFKTNFEYICKKLFSLLKEYGKIDSSFSPVLIGNLEKDIMVIMKDFVLSEFILKEMKAKYLLTGLDATDFLRKSEKTLRMFSKAGYELFGEKELKDVVDNRSLMVYYIKECVGKSETDIKKALQSGNDSALALDADSWRSIKDMIARARVTKNDLGLLKPRISFLSKISTLDQAEEYYTLFLIEDPDARMQQVLKYFDQEDLKAVKQDLVNDFNFANFMKFCEAIEDHKKKRIFLKVSMKSNLDGVFYWYSWYLLYYHKLDGLRPIYGIDFKKILKNNDLNELFEGMEKILFSETTKSISRRKALLIFDRIYTYHSASNRYCKRSGSEILDDEHEKCTSVKTINGYFFELKSVKRIYKSKEDSPDKRFVEEIWKNHRNTLLNWAWLKEIIPVVDRKLHAIVLIEFFLRRLNVSSIVNVFPDLTEEKDLTKVLVAIDGFRCTLEAFFENNPNTLNIDIKSPKVQASDLAALQKLNSSNESLKHVIYWGLDYIKALRAAQKWIGKDFFGVDLETYLSEQEKFIAECPPLLNFKL